MNSEFEIPARPEEVDIEKALDFAGRVASFALVHFPGGGRVQHPEQPTRESAQAFLLAHAGDDIYCHLGILPAHFVGKATKKDVAGSRIAWVDLDPPKDLPQGELDAWRECALRSLATSGLPKPQIIIDSGRGLWVYWLLLVPVGREQIEAINFALAGRFEFGDHCWSSDHVARLPYTRNGKTGRVAYVLRWEEGRTDAKDLPSEKPEQIDAEGIDLGDLGDSAPYRTVAEFEEMVAGLDASDETKHQLLASALDPAAVNDLRGVPLNLANRSAVMFSFEIKAFLAGMTPLQVRNCITSEALPAISDHLLNPKKGGFSERNVIRQLKRALATAKKFKSSVAKQRDGASFSNQSKPNADSEGDQTSLSLVSLAPIPSHLPPRPWAVEGLLMDGQVTLISGSGGEGKSAFALHLAVSMAQGIGFAWWTPIGPRKVLMLNAEDDIDEQRRRLWAATTALGADLRYLENRLFAMEASNLVLVSRDPESKRVGKTKLWFDLVAKIRDENIGLLIVDPLIETHVNLDENSNSDMKELMVSLRDLARARQIPVCLVHHSRKGASGGDQDGARGASAIVNAARAMVTLQRMTEDERKTINPPLPKERYVRVTGAKSNYAGRIGDRWLQVETIELPNGDAAPGFKDAALGEISREFSVQSWEHRERFLNLVRQGRGNGLQWSASFKGPKEARLDAEVARLFGLDAKNAIHVIHSFRNARLIDMAGAKNQSRHETKVWIVLDEPVPEGVDADPF